MNAIAHEHSAQLGFAPDIRVTPKPAILTLAISGVLVGAIRDVSHRTLVTNGHGKGEAVHGVAIIAPRMHRSGSRRIVHGLPRPGHGPHLLLWIT